MAVEQPPEHRRGTRTGEPPPKYAAGQDSSVRRVCQGGPERLAGLYRQLRKAQEDAKNEPGAADFYYGEMEMRRKATTTPAGERAILWLYWLISGYGLRALRSLAALAILGVIVTTALVGGGLAATAPPQHLTGTITSSAGNHTRIDATLNTATPRLPPAGKQWTWQRTRTSTGGHPRLGRLPHHVAAADHGRDLDHRCRPHSRAGPARLDPARRPQPRQTLTPRLGRLGAGSRRQVSTLAACGRVP